MRLDHVRASSDLEEELVCMTLTDSVLPRPFHWGAVAHCFHTNLFCTSLFPEAGSCCMQAVQII